MKDKQHVILCVDDEENILRSLKRSLRKEGYRLLTASSGKEGLKVLSENEVHLIISDQRMPEMSGTEFLALVKEKYPDVIRLCLSGYTEVDAITESINKGNIYKFLLKPWNDHNLQLEIRQALEQYELAEANKMLHEKVLEQNKELTKINEKLEMMVQERTHEIGTKSHALEFSHAILEDLPNAIIGVSAEGMIVLVNRQAQALSFNGKSVELGENSSNYFSDDLKEKMNDAMRTNVAQKVENYSLSDTSHDIVITPLSERFHGKGIVITIG